MHRRPPRRDSSTFDQRLEMHDRWFTRIYRSAYALVIIGVAVSLIFVGAVMYGLYLLYTGQLFP